MRPSHWSSRARLIVWVVVFALLTALNYGAGAGRGAVRPDVEIFFEWRTVVFELLAYGILGAIVLLLSAGMPRAEILALRPPRSWRTAAALMVQVELVWLVVSLVIAGAVGVGGRELAPPRFYDPARIAELVANAAVVALVVPAVEEALSRGVGYWLLAPYGVVPAVLGSGVAFALGHGVIRDLPAILILGVGFSLLRARTGSLYPALILHVLQNGLAVVISGSGIG